MFCLKHWSIPYTCIVVLCRYGGTLAWTAANKYNHALMISVSHCVTFRIEYLTWMSERQLRYKQNHERGYKKIFYNTMVSTFACILMPMIRRNLIYLDHITCLENSHVTLPSNRHAMITVVTLLYVHVVVVRARCCACVHVAVRARLSSTFIRQWMKTNVQDALISRLNAGTQNNNITIVFIIHVTDHDITM